MDILFEVFLEGIGTVVELALDGLIDILTKSRTKIRQRQKLKAYTRNVPKKHKASSRSDMR